MLGHILRQAGLLTSSFGERRPVLVAESGLDRVFHVLTHDFCCRQVGLFRLGSVEGKVHVFEPKRKLEARLIAPLGDVFPVAFVAWAREDCVRHDL